jgi:hypothetical protein
MLRTDGDDASDASGTRDTTDDLAPKLKSRYRVIDGKVSIELKLKSPHQLFDEKDPSPFRERDLDDEAVRYIVSSFREIPSDRDPLLSLYFASMGDFAGNHGIIRKAIHGYFEYEAELKRRELRDTFKQGLISLGIGLAFLFTGTWFSYSVKNPQQVDFFHSLAHEGLFILGWVAMWRPISLFLYEWWPILGAQLTLQKLGRIEIDIRPLDAAHEIDAAYVKNKSARHVRSDAIQGTTMTLRSGFPPRTPAKTPLNRTLEKIAEPMTCHASI